MIIWWLIIDHIPYRSHFFNLILMNNFQNIISSTLNNVGHVRSCSIFISKVCHIFYQANVNKFLDGATFQFPCSQWLLETLWLKAWWTNCSVSHIAFYSVIELWHHEKFSGYIGASKHPLNVLTKIPSFFRSPRAKGSRWVILITFCLSSVRR